MKTRTALTTCLLLCLWLAACGPRLGLGPTPTPSVTASATATRSPTPTFTPPPTPTLTPTPTPLPAPESLLTQAGAACEAAFSQRVAGGTAQRPVLTVVFYEGDPYVGGEWRLPIQGRYTHSLTEAVFAGDVQALVCIREQKVQTGTYTDGEPAYQVRLRVRVTQWDGGQVVAEKSFTGGMPPRTKLGGGPGIGEYPEDEVRAWLLSAFASDAVFAYGGYVSGLALSPNGNLLAVTGSDFSLKVWEVASHRLVYERKGETSILTSFNQPVFSPDGQSLVVPMLGNVAVLDTDAWGAGEVIYKGRDVWSLAFSPSGEQLAAGFGWGDRDLQVTDWPSNTPAFDLSLDGSVSKIAYSADGNMLAAMLHTCGTCPARADTGLRVWNLDGNRLLFERQGFGLEDMALSPDGSLLAYVLEGGREIQVVDLVTGADLPPLAAHQNTVKQLAFSPDGRLLASGDLDGTLVLWDTNGWGAWSTTRGHDIILALAFSSDGAQLVLGGEGSVELWDVPGAR